MIVFSFFQYSVHLLQKTKGRAEFTGQLKKRELASGPVEVEKSTIQVKYTLVRGEKSNEIAPGMGAISQGCTTL